MSESAFLGHGACGDCDSSDALAIYSDHTFCFSCSTYKKGENEAPRRRRKPEAPLVDIELSPWSDPHRGIEAKVLDQYGVYPHGDGVVYIYRDKDAKPCAHKFRDANKKIHWKGQAKDSVGFGEHLANPDHHQAVAICEGEIDAPSIYSGTGGKVVGVSVPNGASGAAAHVKERLDFYLRFKTIYVCTDMDDPGQKAAKEISDLFPAGQVRRVNLPRKDANEVLTELGSMAIREAIQAAQEYRPDGIKPASEFQGITLQAPTRKSVDYPFAFWNAKTPLWDNQLVLLVSGSGIGKTTYCRSLCLGLMAQGKKCGWIGLEEDVKESIFRFVGTHAGVMLHGRTSYADLSEEQLKRIAVSDSFVTRSGLLELYDHFGSLSEETILQRMNYMVRSLNCQYLFLDHLTILGSGLAQDTRHLDAMVTKIRSFIAATGCTVVAVNHLNRGSSQVKNMEDGGVPELHDIRGSHSVVQLADTIWAMGRKRGTQITHTYCLKNRMLGRQGYAGSFVFDEDTQQFEQKWIEPDLFP
jgi:twinkle protein